MGKVSYTLPCWFYSDTIGCRGVNVHLFETSAVDENQLNALAVLPSGDVSTVTICGPEISHP
jgi:hypothetical protein